MASKTGVRVGFLVGRRFRWWSFSVGRPSLARVFFLVVVRWQSGNGRGRRYFDVEGANVWWRFLWDRRLAWPANESQVRFFRSRDARRKVSGQFRPMWRDSPELIWSESMACR